MRPPLAVLALALPALLAAQQRGREGIPETTTATAAIGPPLAPFSAMRVVLVPVQFWRADSTGWSAAASWATFRHQVDSALANGLREGGLGSRWAYGPDVARAARRNPSLNSDPYALGANRWRNAVPQIGENLPPLLADNLRLVTALGDTRYALIPVELRVTGDVGVLRLVLADTRLRTVVWTAEIGAAAPVSFLPTLGERLADLIIEP